MSDIPLIVPRVGVQIVEAREGEQPVMPTKEYMLFFARIIDELKSLRARVEALEP